MKEFLNYLSIRHDFTVILDEHYSLSILAHISMSRTGRSYLYEIQQRSKMSGLVKMFYFDLRPGPKILFQGNTLEGSNTFQRLVIERDRVGGLRLMIWEKVRSHCAITVMHRKRVTSELHDSYFRLMTNKHSISKIQ